MRNPFQAAITSVVFRALSLSLSLSLTHSETMLSSYLRKKVGGKRMSSGHVAAISTLGVASLFGTYCVGEL